MSKKIQDIVTAIKAGRCVLVLGPEICQIDYNRFVKDDAIQNIPKDFDESLKIAYNYYFNHVVDEEERQNIGNNLIQFVDYPFLKEQLMSSPSNNDEEHIYDFARWYFSNTKDWEEHFDKIANIPFPLVLSMIPDNNLENAYLKVLKNKDRFSTSRYSRGEDAVPDISKPTSEKPLIYKLLGDLDDYDATFTFDNWFDYFMSIIGRKTLPTEITSLLKNNHVILFLGVRVEKWYIQLLIRVLLTSSNGKLTSGKKFAYVNSREDSVHELAKNRFQLIFDDTKPTRLLEQIYIACKEENLLRERTLIAKKMNINPSIFISYNHADTEIAHRLKADLEKEDLTVIIDSDNPIGFEIPKFINNSLKEADFILQLISENFLTSAWVAQESVKAFMLAEIGGKEVLPCLLDNSMSDTDFRNKAMTSFDEKAKAIALLMNDRLQKGESIVDLHPQYQRVLELKNSYDSTIAEFRNKNRGDLRGDNYTKGVEQIIKSIRTYQSRT